MGILGAVAFGAIATLAPTESYAADFPVKKVEIMVASREGGSTDQYARIFQPFLQKYLPGQPSVQVVLMPGGGGVGIKASNWFERDAKADGSNLMSTGGSVLLAYVFGGKKIKFNVLGWNPVVMSPFGTCFYAHTKTGVKGKDAIADIKTLKAAGELMMGAKHPTASELRAFISYDILGIDNVKPVYGLTTGQRRKAVLRGELPLSIDSALKCVGLEKKYVKSGKIAIYMTLGFVGEDGAIGRDPAYPKIPHVLEVYKAMHGKDLAGSKLNVFKHFVNMSAMANKILWLPKGTPKNIRDVYAATAKKIYDDKKFQKMTKKSFGEYPQTYGDRAMKIVKDAVDFAPETRSWMLKWIETKMKKTS